MGAAKRVDVADLVYHVWNRGNARGQLFIMPADYVAFEHILAEAKLLFGMRILAYCVMPNHWHMVLQPVNDGDNAKFMHWLTVTHVRRWHEVRGSVGEGHIYQGTYKSHLCQDDIHLLRLIRYVERNALRANLVPRAEEWQWSSGWRRKYGTEQQRAFLAPWPVEVPGDYETLLNEPQSEEELMAIRRALTRGSPLGHGAWFDTMVETHGLASTTRPRGRPKKGT